MATTVLYRISTKEVVKISLAGQGFEGRNAAYWGVLTNPALPDGSACRQVIGATLGALRVLGYAKFAVVGTNTVRNATQAEINTFAAGETADTNLQDATAAVDFFQTHPRYRKAFKAMVTRIVSENNQQSKMWNDFKVEVAASTSFADLKARVAALADLPIRTNAQALTALIGDVSPND